MLAYPCFLCHSVNVEVKAIGRGINVGGLCQDCKAIDDGPDFEDRLARFAARQRVGRSVRQQAGTVWDAAKS